MEPSSNLVRAATLGGFLLNNKFLFRTLIPFPLMSTAFTIASFCSDDVGGLLRLVSFVLVNAGPGGLNINEYSDKTPTSWEKIINACFFGCLISGIGVIARTSYLGVKNLLI